MANHDFNRPCNCRECREESRVVTCPSCQEVYKVVTERSSEFITDRKGISDYIFSAPVEPEKTLTCECGHVIPSVGYYTYIDVRGSEIIREKKERLKAAPKCSGCGLAEDIDWAKGSL